MSVYFDIFYFCRYLYLNKILCFNPLFTTSEFGKILIKFLRKYFKITARVHFATNSLLIPFSCLLESAPHHNGTAPYLPFEEFTKILPSVMPVVVKCVPYGRYKLIFFSSENYTCIHTEFQDLIFSFLFRRSSL